MNNKSVAGKAANISIAFEHYQNRKANRPKQKFVAKTGEWKKVKGRKSK